MTSLRSLVKPAAAAVIVLSLHSQPLPPPTRSVEPVHHAQSPKGASLSASAAMSAMVLTNGCHWFTNPVTEAVLESCPAARTTNMTLTVTLNGATDCVTLCWNMPDDPTVSGANIYYGTASEQYTTVTNPGYVTNLTVAGLAQLGPPFIWQVSPSLLTPTWTTIATTTNLTLVVGTTNAAGFFRVAATPQTYYFAAATYNTNKVQSPFSNEVRYTPPASTNAVVATAKRI